MKNICRCLSAITLLSSAWGQAYAQNMAAAAAAAVRPVVQVAPMPMSISPSFGQPSSLAGASSINPSLTPSLPNLAPAAVSVSHVLPSAVSPSVARSVSPAVSQSVVSAAAPAVAQVSRPAAVLPSLPGAAKAAVLPTLGGASREEGNRLAGLSLREGLAVTAKALRPEPGKREAGVAAAQSTLGRMFDGAGRSRPGAVSTKDFRPPSWSEDRAINKAIARLSQSPIGADIYKYVYDNHRDLRILVDDDKSAVYDARLDQRSGKPVIYLTEALVRKQSAEVVAAYLAREMSDLYFAAFPASAERGYMAYSNMVRAYAELTNSGQASRRYWWDTGRDQWTGEAYAMQRYYGSWKEAVADYQHQGRDIRNSPFFRFLQGRDDSNADPLSKLSLPELYRQGKITWARYQEMNTYYAQFLGSETSWLSQSGRW